MSQLKNKCEGFEKNSCLAVDCRSCPSRINSIFSDLVGKDLDQLNSHKTNNTYKKGQKLFYEGNPSKGVFCVVSGKVKITKNGVDGKETLLKIASCGDVVGIKELLTDYEYTTSAETMEKASICFVNKIFIDYLIAKDSDLSLKIIQKISSDLEGVEDRLSDMQNRNVKQRLAKLLLVLQKIHGQDTDKGRFLNVKLTRSELASMISATPESVMRELSELNAQKLIFLESKKIYILNLSGMAELAFYDL